MGPNGLVPTLLEYGKLPRLPPSNSPFPYQQQLMRFSDVSRRDISTVVDNFRLLQDLLSRIPQAENYIFAPGDEVRAFREPDHKLHGPYSRY